MRPCDGGPIARAGDDLAALSVQGAARLEWTPGHLSRLAARPDSWLRRARGFRRAAHAHVPSGWRECAARALRGAGDRRARLQRLAYLDLRSGHDSGGARVLGRAAALGRDAHGAVSRIAP